MTTIQTDLFAEPGPARNRLGDGHIARLKAQLETTLALVEGATAMPWTRLEDIIHADNGFRFGTEQLPSTIGEPLWERFDRQMDRLYAIMNEGKELPPLP